MLNYQKRRVGLGYTTAYPSMDFETYSEAGFNIDAAGKVKGAGSGSKGGLPVVGTPVYAEHPTTEVICLYYDLKDGKGVRGWMPSTPEPTDLIEHIRRGGPIEAHNFTFEFYIWNMVCTRRYGWPPLQLSQGFCTMAKARRFSLPGSLGKLAKVLGTAQKDNDGSRLIQKLCRPHTVTKNRSTVRHAFGPDTFEEYRRMWAYCADDVRAEDAAAERMPDLTDYERATWLTDQTINVRGVRVDVAALDAALRIMRDMTQHFTLELCQITQGAVGGASEVAKILTWLAERGTRLPSLGADDVREALTLDTLPQDARRVLEIRQALAGANIKKLPALKMQVSRDGRLRDQYMYCGADRTGRWSAGGVQLQNITSKGPKSKSCDHCGRYVQADCLDCPACMGNAFTKASDWTVEAVECAIGDMLNYNGDLSAFMDIWGDPSTVLAGCLRGMFFAAQGKRLICCDFSAIEAVVAACLSRCQWRIDVFSGHGKIYEMSASKITGTPIEEYFAYKKANGFDHPDRKKIGKVAELASGYGGWVNAWRNFGADMDDDEIKRQILAWRDASPEIVEMWGGQFRTPPGGKPWDGVPELYGLEGMAVAAILNPGQCFHYIDISYAVYDDVLYCRLPSGRFLCYHRPKLVSMVDRMTKKPAYKITFEGYNSNAVKGPVGWVVLETYGGRLFENVVQAVSADIQAEALVRLERSGYPVVMHTHDEAIAEVEHGRGSVDEMAAIMTERPQWASWWPLRAAGWEHERYQKD